VDLLILRRLRIALALVPVQSEGLVSQPGGHGGGGRQQAGTLLADVASVEIDASI
jgi:hypothetical protein